MTHPARKPGRRGPAERNALAEANLALARWLANRRTGPALRLDNDDAVQVASLGLLRAAELYRPESGCAFTTYAWRWIRQHLQRHGGRESVVRVPDHVRDGECARRALGCRRLHEADVRKLAAREGPDAGAAIDVRDALRFLPAQDRRVVELRYYEGLTMEEAGQRLGVTRERIRQLEARALRRLRTRLGPDRSAPCR